jgi:hypothetical protein
MFHRPAAISAMAQRTTQLSLQGRWCRRQCGEPSLLLLLLLLLPSLLLLL